LTGAATVLQTLWTINLLRPVLIVSAINYASGAQYCGKESENNSTISNLMCVLLMRARFGERERKRESVGRATLIMQALVRVNCM
jgi:hypothetical protein